MYDIAIIGAGASGLVASIFAKKENSNADVVLFEKFDRVGKKIALTGNGQCNVTNAKPEISRYHGDPEFARFALSEFTPEQQKAFFEECGVAITFEESGKAYPLSYQASSVVDALRFRAAELGVEIRCDTRIDSITKKEKGFGVAFGKEKITAKSVIVACGGAAGGKLGSVDGYSLLEGLGHKKTALRPAIVQLKTNPPFLRSLKGIKLTARLTAKDKNNTYTAEIGDLLFTDYGISGPAVLSLSSYYKQGAEFTVFADLVPTLSADETLSLLLSKWQNLGNRSAEELLAGILHRRLGIALIKHCGISPAAPICSLTDSDIKAVNGIIHRLPFEITDTNGMSNAQVTAGGISTAEFDSKTMMSKLHEGLFAAGEVLNVDGDCGGFNLCFAWSSGRLAGISAAKRVGK